MMLPKLGFKVQLLAAGATTLVISGSVLGISTHIAHHQSSSHGAAVTESHVNGAPHAVLSASSAATPTAEAAPPPPGTPTTPHPLQQSTAPSLTPPSRPPVVTPAVSPSSTPTGVPPLTASLAKHITSNGSGGWSISAVVTANAPLSLCDFTISDGGAPVQTRGQVAGSTCTASHDFGYQGINVLVTAEATTGSTVRIGDDYCSVMMQTDTCRAMGEFHYYRPTVTFTANAQTVPNGGWIAWPSVTSDLALRSCEIEIYTGTWQPIVRSSGASYEGNTMIGCSARGDAAANQGPFHFSYSVTSVNGVTATGGDVPPCSVSKSC